MFLLLGLANLAGAAQPPYHATRERTYHVHHYALTVSLDLDAKKLDGEAAISFSPLRPGLDTLRLDAAGMTIERVALKDKKASHPLTFRTDSASLNIALGRECRTSDSLTVLVTYHVVNPKKGLYFTLPDSGYPLKQKQAWTQGEPEDNHYWFPCYDFPNDFSSSEVIATVPEPSRVVSNGILVAETHDKKNNRSTWHWLEPKPHVSYLISLAAGTYTEVKDHWKTVPVSSFVYPHQRAVAGYSFAKTPKMIGFFSEMTGIPYPWEKFGQTVVQDFIFGGEENVTAVTLNDGTIHDARADLDFSSDPLVSHELAHMWWGDLVTCRDWSHAWLNEGFATYFENLFMGFDKGRDDAEKEIRDTQAGLTISDVRDRRRPTVSGHYNNPIELFDGRIYGKGACILTMLRHQLGDELFWKSVRGYIRKHQYGNVETNDFLIAIEEATGYNLDWFFDQWVYKAGFPEFSVSWTWNDTTRLATVDVVQTQERDSLTGIFRTPVDIEIWVDGKSETHTVIADSQRQHFTFPAAHKPQLVLFDKGSVILKRLVTVKPIDEWLFQLEHAEHAVDREMAIENLRADVDTPRVAAVLARTMLNDSFWDCRRSAAFALGSSTHPMPPDDFLTAARDRDARVRAAVVGALADYPAHAGAVRELTRAFREDSSYSVASAALTALTSADSAHAWQWCLEGLQRDSYKETIRSAALRSMMMLGGDSAFAQAMKYTKYGIDRELRVSTLWLLSRTWKDTGAVVSRCVALLHDPSFQVRRAVIDILASLKAPAALEPLRASEKTETDGRLVQAARDAIRRIEQ